MSKSPPQNPSSSLKFEEPVELLIPMPWGHVSAKGYGNPSNSPVLGLHGWMDNSGTFDRLVPYLSSSLYFVALDFPGMGLSSHLPPGMPYHFGDFLIVIKRITSYLKWSKFSIVGHSMGAGLGAFFASMYPAMVEKLVMLDMIKPMSSDEGTTAQSMSQAIDFYLSIEEKVKPDFLPSYSYKDAMNRLITATDNSLTEEAAKCLMTRGTVRVDEDKWAFRRDLKVRSPTIYRFSHEASLQFLKDIKCHHLLIKAKSAPTFGGPDEIVKRTLDLYREKCASFQYVEVEGNHFVHLNEPEKIAGLVDKFLTQNGLEATGIYKSGL